VVAALALACVLGAAANLRGGIDAYRRTTETDYSRPVTRDLGGGAIETTYPTRTVEAPWGAIAEEVLHDAAKGAGAALALALPVYGVLWQIRRLPARTARRAAGAPGRA
jgi:hypothetical protein